ncbi:hypothetical protein [Legionella waltersii]|uniref:Uncharacterized protein n=1 Tax=Legionella waltersii TaxID=66969 RepID=A0A0W1AP14_9GAMM|nr:hypothetical protein [Legionella waltersii]KTD83068.1 hypothetical protein Lwal_0056 [Legionella waltersii]SNV08166.1 Uncharacterised protein [Legionella waltersii]
MKEVSRLKIQMAKKYLHKKIKQGDNGYPAATVAYYGPNADIASKVVVTILLNEDDDPAYVEKWYSSMDIRKVDFVHLEIVEFIKSFQVRSIFALGEKILGCPHEEGIDYEENGHCPECPYWKDKDRWDL